MWSDSDDIRHGYEAQTAGSALARQEARYLWSARPLAGGASNVVIRVGSFVFAAQAEANLLRDQNRCLCAQHRCADPNPSAKLSRVPTAEVKLAILSSAERSKCGYADHHAAALLNIASAYDQRSNHAEQHEVEDDNQKRLSPSDDRCDTSARIRRTFAPQGGHQ